MYGHTASAQSRYCVVFFYETAATDIYTDVHTLSRHDALPISREEQELSGALVGIDLRGQGRGVGEFQSHMAFPFGFQRRDVDDDAAARVGALAEADHQHIARDAEIFHRAGQRKRVRRDDADIGLAEIGRHTSELQSLMRISYAVFCLKKKNEQQKDMIT